MTCLVKALFLWGILCILLALTTPVYSVVANEWCSYNETQEGRCLTDSECAENHPKGLPDLSVYCGYEKDTRLVCCPLRKVQSGRPQDNTSTIFAVPGIIAKEWCSYYKTACPAKGRQLESSQDEGNALAGKDEFPHMAAIGYGEQDSIIWGCGGSLVSENFVLTAANCLRYGSNPAAWVRLGTAITQNHLRSTEGEGQTHPVIKRIKHPEFKASSKYYNIALLKIGSALEANALPTMSRNIHPACLQADEERLSEALVIGWGSLGYGNEEILHLQKLSTNILRNSECNITFRTEISETQQLLRGIDDSMTCAKSIATCKGDSGGALQTIKDEESCLHQIIGVTSFAKSCGLVNATAVYSRVTYFIQWIEEQVWKQREICSLGDGEYGECKLSRECTHILSRLGEGNKPVSCGFEGKEPILCCPFPSQDDETTASVPRIGSEIQQEQVEVGFPGEKAKKACNKYKNACNSTSDSEHEDQYPHLAFIGYGEIENILWGCGASLISEDFVLTAAHCITDIEKKRARWVRLGSQITESDYRKSSNGSVIGQIHPILRIIQHPEYDEPSHLNDLALLKIGVAVEPNAFSTLSSSIHPACLQVSKNPISEAVGVGISEIGTGDHHPNTIQKANLTIVSNSVCNVITRMSLKPQEGLDELFLCAEVTSRDKFLCTFNSEGPLHIPNHEGSCLRRTVGILTLGQLCGYNNATIIYTQIYPYMQWIEENVWPYL